MMQTKAGIGAKTNDAAGIRDFWFEEYELSMMPLKCKGE